MYINLWMPNLFSVILVLLVEVALIDVSSPQLTTLSTLDFQTHCTYITFSVRASGSPRYWSYDFLINDRARDLAVVNIGINSTYYLVSTDAGNSFLGQYRVSTSRQTVSTQGSDPFDATLEFFNLTYNDSGSAFFAARGSVTTPNYIFNQLVCPRKDRVKCDDANCECNTNVEFECISGNLRGSCQDDGTYSTSCPVQCETWSISLVVVFMLICMVLEVVSLWMIKKQEGTIKAVIFYIVGVLFSIAGVLVVFFGCEAGTSFPQWAIVLIVALLVDAIFLGLLVFLLKKKDLSTDAILCIDCCARKRGNETVDAAYTAGKSIPS